MWFFSREFALCRTLVRRRERIHDFCIQIQSTSTEEYMIHQYKLNGFNIVLDVCSGSVHVVDEVAYDIIAEFENKEKDVIIGEMLEKYASDEVSEADVLECYAQIEELKANGKLFAPDTFEPMANKLKEKTAGVVKALCLHIAHTCNLNCSYCFASQGKYHGD